MLVWLALVAWARSPGTNPVRALAVRSVVVDPLADEDQLVPITRERSGGERSQAPPAPRVSRTRARAQSIATEDKAVDDCQRLATGGLPDSSLYAYVLVYPFGKSLLGKKATQKVAKQVAAVHTSVVFCTGSLARMQNSIKAAKHAAERKKKFRWVSAQTLDKNNAFWRSDEVGYRHFITSDGPVLSTSQCMEVDFASEHGVREDFCGTATFNYPPEATDSEPFVYPVGLVPPSGRIEDGNYQSPAQRLRAVVGFPGSGFKPAAERNFKPGSYERMENNCHAFADYVLRELDLPVFGEKGLSSKLISYFERSPQAWKKQQRESQRVEASVDEFEGE